MMYTDIEEPQRQTLKILKPTAVQYNLICVDMK